MKSYKELVESIASSITESVEEFVFSGETRFMKKNEAIFNKFGAKISKKEEESGWGEDITNYYVKIDKSKVRACGDAFEKKDKNGEFYGGYHEAE